MTYICLKSLKRRVQVVSRFPRFIQVRPDSLQIDFNLSRGKDTKRFVTVNWLKPGVDMFVFVWSFPKYCWWLRDVSASSLMSISCDYFFFLVLSKLFVNSAFESCRKGAI